MFNTRLNQALISEILMRIRAGEVGYCKKLGFDESELAVLIQLSTSEIYDLCESVSSFIKVDVNHKIFWNLINAAREKTKERNTIDRALELGISGEMLRNRFGWSSAEVSARRKLLGIQENIGRKKNASEDDEIKIWELWQEYKPVDISVMDNKDEGLDLLMLISEESNVSLTEVWRLISTWINEESKS